MRKRSREGGEVAMEEFEVVVGHGYASIPRGWGRGT